MSNCPACDGPFDRMPGDAFPYRCARCQSRVLGVYCDLTLIGSGAMGDVYQARRPNMGNRTVAIKIPKESEPRTCSRFEREIAASARLRHENIICAFDRGEEEGRPYLVMEFVAGSSLSDIVDAQHPLAPAEAARIVRQIAGGLAHAAQQRIVNRDIKPDNILIASDGTAKILDYDLALIAELDGPDDRVTRNGTLLGTPGFLAPEQANDPRGVNIAADVYALGCTAHYILTRRPPFSAKDSFGILKQHATAPRPSVRAKRPDVNEELDELIQRMMAVSPEKRPSPRELVQQLDRMMPHLNSSRPSVASAVSGRIDARCPSCEQVFHLRSDMVGKRMRCPNKLCGKLFTVEPQLGPTVSFTDTPVGSAPMASPLNLQVPEAEPLEAEAVDAEPVDAEPLEAEAVEAEAVEAEPVEAEAMEAEPVEAEAMEAEPVEAEAMEAEPVEAEAFPDIPPVQLGAAPPMQQAAPLVEAPPTLTEFEPPPIQADVPTIQAYTGVTDTPREEVVEVVTARTTEPPPPQQRYQPEEPWQPERVQAASLPPVQWPARDDGRLAAGPAMHELPPVQGAIATAPDMPAAPPRQATTAAAPAAAKRKPARKPRRHVMLWSVLGLTCLMLVGSGVAGWQVYRKLHPTPEVLWDKVTEAYSNKKWDEAVAGFKKFQQDFPEHENVEQIPFYLSMSAVGKQVYSDGDTEDSFKKMEELFREYRDKPAYKLHLADLYSSFQRLVERFTEEATKDLNVAKIERARAAFNSLTTVAESMEDAWVPDRTRELSAFMDKTETTVRSKRAFKDALALLKQGQDANSGVKADDVYAAVASLQTKFPELSENKDFLTELDATYRSEPGRVRYVNQEDSETAAAPANASDSTDLFVVWDDRKAASPQINRRQVLTTLSRGVLYVFDVQGNFLWARRMGVDSYRLPLHTPATATSPAAVITVSTEDNTLLSLDAENDGRVLWQYKSSGDISSPLTIVTVPSGPNLPDKQRALLPTADGNINVLELVLGKQLGRFEIGYPLASVGGGYDPQNQLVYFPADSQRVFAINPLVIDNLSGKEPACKSVLFTEHASGGLRSEPTVVDRDTLESYLIMSEASDLDHMQLRVFDLSSSKAFNPRAKSINKATTLDGWSWFSPLASPDRITLVTDKGDLGVFGLNLDNKLEESIYRVIENKDVEGNRVRLPVADRFRSLAADSDERYLWVMAGGTLRKLKLDLLGQRINTIWPAAGQAAEVTGIPLHEAQLDDRGDHLFLGMMATDGSHYDFTAVDAKAGNRVWERQLGVKLFADPIPVGQKVLLIDQAGRTLLLDPEESRTVYQPAGDASLPPGADLQRLTRIRDNGGQPYLALPLSDSKQLAIASLEETQAGAISWQVLPLPGTLQGRPCICGGFLIAPCADGTLNRVPMKPGVRLPINEQPAFWMPGQNKNPGPETASVYPLTSTAILLTAAGRSIRRMEIRDVQNVSAWRQVGGEFTSEAPVLGQVLVVGQQALVTDENGTVSAFDIADPGKWHVIGKLGGRPTSEPFLRGDKLIAVIDGRKLVAIAPNSPEKQPLWTSEPLAGRIRGQPVLAGDVLLVADESRHVTALQLADGKAAWSVALSPRIGPSATAVPFGKNRILVPLTDGTFTVVPYPAADKQLAESGQ